METVIIIHIQVINMHLVSLSLAVVNSSRKMFIDLRMGARTTQTFLVRNEPILQASQRCELHGLEW